MYPTQVATHNALDVPCSSHLCRPERDDDALAVDVALDEILQHVARQRGEQRVQPCRRCRERVEVQLPGDDDLPQFFVVNVVRHPERVAVAVRPHSRKLHAAKPHTRAHKNTREVAAAGRNPCLAVGCDSVRTSSASLPEPVTTTIGIADRTHSTICTGAHSCNVPDTTLHTHIHTHKRLTMVFVNELPLASTAIAGKLCASAVSMHAAVVPSLPRVFVGVMTTPLWFASTNGM